ncbi:MAG TPA: hypothetical protein VJN70_17285 [Gemmatimonadaceae bacterium]|nr:hypothetical protein [Gemmatimonadaceae bacterium]
MTYTLWHRKQLIGETEFEQERHPPQMGEGSHLAGIFHPNDYGRRLLPRLCGMLTAGLDLKEELVRRGLPTEDPSPDVVEELFETTEAGAHIIDIGRVLSEVELRDPMGVTLKVSTMAFIDLAELATLSRRLGENETVDLEHVPPDVADFLVSVTLSDLSAECRPMMPLQ